MITNTATRLLVRTGGWILLLAAFAVFATLATGIANDWILENWTCGDGRGRSRECGQFESLWSAWVLDFAAMFGGFLMVVLSGKPRPAGEPVATIDLSRFRQRA